MQVSIVSTYPPQRCGIGTYTARLSRALANEGNSSVTVLSERGALDVRDGPVRSVVTFRREDDYVQAIVRKAVEVRADVVHVQHSPDIFGMDARMPLLLSRLKACGIRSVVTLHTVHTTCSGAIERRFRVASFHRKLGEAADALVVHGQHTMADELVEQGVPRSKISTIAHGTTDLATVDREAARHQLGLPIDGPVLLYFGFIHPQKNVHTILLAFRPLIRRVPNCRLYLAGSVQNPIFTNRVYRNTLRWLIHGQGLGDHVVFREEYVPAEEAPVLYGAADLVLLPYAQRYGSASGIVHDAFGAGKVPLCSRSPKFAEVGVAIDSQLLISTHSPRAWADAIADLLGNPVRLARLRTRVQQYAAKTSWGCVAEQHRTLYERILSVPCA